MEVMEPIRQTTTFFIANADKIAMFAKGTLLVSVSALDSTIFFATLLNAISKPVYGMYFAYQGLLAGRIKEKAFKEFEKNQRALTNFLLGSAAVEGSAA